MSILVTEVIEELEIQAKEKTIQLHCYAKDGAYLVNEPRALMNTLRANNITEANSYLVREYISRNPHHLDEVKELLRKHINETKKH